MFRRTRGLLLACCLAGCGGFLGLAGDDDEDVNELPGSSIADASPDGLEAGESQGQVLPGADAETDADGTAGGDAVADAPKDSPDDAFDGSATACNGKAACERYVFVTSTTLPGNFMSTLDPNDVCKLRADSATSAGDLKGRAWRAWVSTSTVSALQNLGVAGTMRYKLPNGTTVANDLTDLVDGSLAHGIDRDETNTERIGAVWTATGANGAHIAPGCNGFTTAANGTNGKVGNAASTSGAWTDANDQGCGMQARLYCVEY